MRSRFFVTPRACLLKLPRGTGSSFPLRATTREAPRYKVVGFVCGWFRRNKGFTKGAGVAALFSGVINEGGGGCLAAGKDDVMALAGNHGHAGGARLDKNVERLLSEPWGAAKAGVHYNKETLASLCDEFARLEPQARRGALQGTLFMRQSQRESLHEEVRHLVNLAVDDKDQWASLIARALGGLKERFDLQQLQQDVPAVRSLSPRPPRSVSGARAR